MSYKITLAERSDIPELTALWQEAFGDNEAFISPFLDAYLIPFYNAPCVKVDGVIVSVLYLIDFDLYSNRAQIGQCSYLFAAATKKEHRDRGYMRELLEYSEEILGGRGIKAVFLFPQEEPLFGYYGKSGYKYMFGAAVIDTERENSVCGNTTDCRIENKSIDDVELFDNLYENYVDFTVRQEFSPLKDRYFYFRCAASYLETDKKNTYFGLFKNNVENLCYVFYKISKNCFQIDDIILCDKYKNLSGEEYFSAARQTVGLIVAYMKQKGYRAEITLPVQFAQGYNYEIKNTAMCLLPHLTSERPDKLKVLNEYKFGEYKEENIIYLNMYMNI